MPGGGVEANENPKVAAARESKEEVNVDLDVTQLKLVDIIFKPSDDSLLLMYEYSEPVKEEIDYSVNDEEIEGYKFFAPHDMPKLLPEYYQEFLKKHFNV